jgi:hypothetical protein
MAKRPKSAAVQLHIVDPGPAGETVTTTASPLLLRGIDRVLWVQRPVVLAHLGSIRHRHPNATNAEIIRILERRYLAAVTAGGAAVGATAMVPAIGTGISLALSAAETAGFLETTALFAQSITEVHGIALADQDRARALVMTMVLGDSGTTLVRQLAGQVIGEEAGRTVFWGEMITSSIPQFIVGPVVDQLKGRFVRSFAAREGASIIGRVVPFGVGAAIGGVGNHLLGRKIIESSRTAFGEPPIVIAARPLPQELQAPPAADGPAVSPTVRPTALG